MFSGLSNLIWGNTQTETAEETQESPRRLKSEESDDEWEFVDKNSSSRIGTPVCSRRVPVNGDDPLSTVQPMSTSQTMSSSINSSDCDADSSTGEPRVKGNYLEHGSDSEAVLSDVSSVPEMLAHPSMGESWLMTPPPCFTAGNGSPARQVETHPMENLLIEHPSMSVYDTRGRPSSTGHESDNGHESSSDTEMTEDSPSGNSGRSRAVTSHSSGRSRVITAKQQLLAEQRVQKSMQSLQKKKDGKKLTKSQLQRSNLVAHVNSCGKSNRRLQVMQPRSSGAKTNTKSQ